MITCPSGQQGFGRFRDPAIRCSKTDIFYRKSSVSDLFGKFSSSFTYSKMVFSDYLRMVSLIVFGGKGLVKQDLGTVSQATGADLHLSDMMCRTVY